MIQDLKRYQRMKAREIRTLPKEILQELARDKQSNGNASSLAKRAQVALFNMGDVRSCEITTLITVIEMPEAKGKDAR